MSSQDICVNLILLDDVIDSLDCMGKYTGAGRAMIIRELLLEGRSGLKSMVDVLELAVFKNVDAFGVIVDVMRQVSNDAGQLELDIRKQRCVAMRKRVK